MKTKKIINYIVILLSVISFIVLQYYILKLDILPKKYYLLITFIEVLLVILSIIFLIIKKNILNIISVVLSVLLIILNSFGLYYIRHLDRFIDKGFSGDVINVSTYYLLSSNSNSISKLEEVTLDKKIYYYSHSINNDVAREKFGNYDYILIDDLSTYLVDNKESNNYLLLDKLNFNTYKEFNTDVAKYYKVIYEFDIKTTEKRSIEVKDSYNVLVTGKDFGGHNDLNLLITVNNRTHQILLTSMTRGLYVNAYGYDAPFTITYLNSLGDDVVVKTLEEFYDTTIDFTVNIYTENFVDLVDKVGGVEFCSPKNFTTTHAKVLGTYDDTTGKKMYVKKGCRNYNGIEILTISRERLAFNPKGDHQRQENCRQIMINIVKKVASLSTLSNYSEILDSLNNLFTTNMNRNTMTVLVRNALNNIEYEVLEEQVGGEEYQKPIGLHGWVGPAIIANSNDKQNARNKIKEILNN